MSKSSKSNAECVKVVIRCRPMSEKETADGHKCCVAIDSHKGTIEIRNPKPSAEELPRNFTFDAVYDWNSRQKDLYTETFQDLVQSVLEGFNGTIFAYGQTGTGKTFTMQGVKDDAELRGVIPNSFEHVFDHISQSKNAQYLVRASYLEIYKEDVRDLLHKDQQRTLEIKEKPDTGVYVKDLSSVLTKSVKEIEKVMNIGNANRSVGATNMNLHSSRSHAIFIVTIECSELGIDGENHIRVGKLNMVDLAGSERQSKTQAEGERLKEATKINLSLSALGNVISALVDSKSTHIPYRDSKLTRLLQDSLGGNSRTVMVANIGPADYNYDESLNTLRYANRAKSIKNKPKINEDPKDALLREYQTEIERLKNMLSRKGDPGRSGERKKKRVRRVRQRKLADGTVEEISESESGSDEEGDEEDEEAFRQEQKRLLEKEKESIMNDKSLIAEEKQKLLSDLKDKESRLNEERAQKAQLESKLKAMESKLLCGGRDIIDHTQEQQKALEQQRQELAERKRRERQIQEEMEQKEETIGNIQESFSTLKQEIEYITKKLRKLFEKVQSIKQEIDDSREEHIVARQEVEHVQEQLTRELKLRLLIIENFIPPEEHQKLLARCTYDQDENKWSLKPLSNSMGGDAMSMAERPTSAIGGRRPISEYARMASSMGNNPRFKGENLLSLDLDLPNRTTRDYEPPGMAPQVVAALEAALQDEEDIELDGRTSAIKNNSNKDKSKKKERRSQICPSTHVGEANRQLSNRRLVHGKTKSNFHNHAA